MVILLLLLLGGGGGGGGGGPGEGVAVSVEWPPMSFCCSDGDGSGESSLIVITGCLSLSALKRALATLRSFSRLSVEALPDSAAPLKLRARISFSRTSLRSCAASPVVLNTLAPPVWP